MAFKPSEEVILPIGIRHEGQVYRRVIMDEMTGVDEENMARKTIRNNGAKAVSVLLQRTIQEIPGLVDRKTNPNDKIDASIIRGMFVADRDFLLINLRAMSMEESLEVEVQCPNCKTMNPLSVPFTDLDFMEWEAPEENPTAKPGIEIDLPRGIVDADGNVHEKVIWNFPTGKQQERLAALQRHQVQTATIAACVEVPTMEGPLDTETVKRMYSRDREHIMLVAKEWTPGLDLRIEMICDGCDWSWLSEISPANFFQQGSRGQEREKRGGRSGRVRRRKG